MSDLQTALAAIETALAKGKAAKWQDPALLDVLKALCEVLRSIDARLATLEMDELRKRRER